MGNAHVTVMYVVWHSMMSNLNIHWYAYNDDLSPNCYVCRKPFSNNGALNTHARNHAGDVDTPVMCIVSHSLIGVV